MPGARRREAVLRALRALPPVAQLADVAMMPAKDVRETLYRMLKSGFVCMQASRACLQ